MACACCDIRRPKRGAETPLPRFEVFVLLCIIGSEGFALNSLFSFVVFMVREFGYSDPADVTFYAAFVGSCFGLAQFAGSFYWGLLSDRYGRRPVLLFGLVGSTICMILFGTSKSLPFALVTRALNGLLNGNSGVARTYMREITDSTNQARGFALFGTAWGVGSIVGPTIGGYLSYPDRLLPSLFPPGSIFTMHPFLLPCAVSSLVSLAGFVIGFCCLRETHPSPSRPSWWPWRDRPARGAGAASSTNGGGGAASRHARVELVPLASSSDEEEGGSRSERPSRGSSAPGAATRQPSAKAQWRVLGGAKAKYEQLATATPGPGVGGNDGDGNGTEFGGAVPEAGALAAQDGLASERRGPVPATTADKNASGVAVLRSLIRTPSVMLILLINANLAFCVVCLQELFPLWASSPVDAGGLDFHTDNIGTVLACAGAVLIVYSVLILPKVEACMGARKMLIVFTGAYLPVAVLTPAAHFFVDVPPAVWALLISLYTIRGTAGPTLFSAAALLVNNATANNVGALNGLLTSVMALVRAVGPAIGGMVLSWSQSNNLGWPLDYHFVFTVLGFLMLANIFMAICLPPWVDVRAEERTDADLEDGGGGDGRSDDGASVHDATHNPGAPAVLMSNEGATNGGLVKSTRAAPRRRRSSSGDVDAQI